MYSLPSYLPGDIKVEPTSGMYQLESFHDILPSTRISTKDFDPVKDLEMKQLTLIQRLVSFNKALEEHLKGEKKLPQKSDGQPVEESVKETKKKGKPEASALKSRANKNVDKIENITARAPFKIQEEKVPAEFAGGITACATPVIASFPTQKSNNIVMKVTKADMPWVHPISKIASSRGFSFSGVVQNDCSGVNGSITLQQNDSVSISIGGGESVNGRVSSLKLLGAILGLFSFESSRALQATHAHIWLTRLDEALSDGGENVEHLKRRMSEFLARFDTLSADAEISLVDFVIRPFMTHQSLPNNVELWAKRVFSMGFHRSPEEHQKGARDFVFWHWAQLQFHNPKVQLVKHVDKVITPFAQAFLKDSRSVVFDLEGLTREEIEKELITTLGKTEIVRKRESLEKIAKLNPASFGSNCPRQCMCEVQGQHPCTALLHAPSIYTGKYRWNHNLI